MKDISTPIENLALGSKIIITKSSFIIASGEKYGLIARNGEGKTTIINYITKLHILESTDIYVVNQEFPVDENITVFDLVLQSNKELYETYKKLELLEKNNANYDEQYCQITEKLVELDYDFQKSKIHRILAGLGFLQEQHYQNAITFSGGWRMRMSLACALYRMPELLILDEPTNHLDLEANIWLCNYLTSYKNTIILITHDISFLNDVCTSIIHLDNKELKYYKGAYYKFKKQWIQDITTAERNYKEIEKRINAYKKSGKTKNEVASFMKHNPLPYVPVIKSIIIDFGEISGNLENLITLDNVSFSYVNSRAILENITFAVNASSHIALVGSNGNGKTTLIKLLAGEIQPVNGTIERCRQIRIGYFNQHTIENLPKQMTPLEYIKQKYNYIGDEEIRGYLGKIGLKGNEHTLCMENLSGGQKMRVALVDLQILKPHVILMDEPTNHLDIYTIDALKQAINNFNGGVVLITHNIDLINDTECQVYLMPKCEEINYETYVQEIITRN